MLKIPDFGNAINVVEYFKGRHNLKQTFIILTIFLLTTLFACGQKSQTSKFNNQQDLIDNLKNKIDQKWVRENPLLSSTKPSFFNKDNENKYFVGLLQISGQSVPFTWDDNLSLLQFILTLDNGINVKQETDADKNFKGTKIVWNKNINGLIWFNDKTYKATIDNYHLFGFTECPGTIIFPSLSFRKVTVIPNAITNNIQGLTILPYNDNFKIKSTETTLTTKKGLNIKGVAYDLNNDNIFDIFTFTEEIDETNLLHQTLYERKWTMEMQMDKFR